MGGEGQLAKEKTGMGSGKEEVVGFDLTIANETYILKSFVSGRKSFRGRVRQTRVYDESSALFS
jgi:hypothetical protein